MCETMPPDIVVSVKSGLPESSSLVEAFSFSGSNDGDGAINLMGITGTKIGDVGGRSSPLAIELPACIRGRCF